MPELLTRTITLHGTAAGLACAYLAVCVFVALMAPIWIIRDIRDDIRYNRESEARDRERARN